MAQSSMDAFQTLWRAYGEGRLERAFDLVADDCEVSFADGSTALRGHDGIRDWLAAERRDWKTVTITYDEVTEERPGCVLGVGTLAAASADGSTNIDFRIAFVAEFGGGRLVRGRMFGDRDAAAEYVSAL